MKIAIIGAGWVGCHLTKILKDEGHHIDLFESDDIFSSTSYYNQNRLHLGFHYARNQRTRNLCKSTFNSFLSEYGEFVNEVPRNIYGVPNSSIIDFGTYKAILEHDNIEFEPIQLKSLKGVEGTVNTKEMHIDYKRLKIHFKKLLAEQIQYRKIDSIESISSEYDFVINCTNNFIPSPGVDSYYELALSLVYKKIGNPEFDGLTLVDGNFFSIYPYTEDLYTLTDVEYTPLICADSSSGIMDLKSMVKEEEILEIRDKIVDKVLKIYPNFLSDFEYSTYFTSIKSKTYNQSADRYPIITTNSNVINCFTGKIQGIYVIENFVKNYIMQNES